MKKINFLTLLFSILSVPSFAFQDMADVEIKVIPVQKNIYMLTGSGGNIGISVGEDGVFMIDDEFAPLSQKIIAAIKTISDKPVKYLINTHFHGDHTGGNANFEQEGAIILAQDNVRKRLKADEKQNGGLPIITFNEDVMIHVNGDDIIATHVHNAHTDGDAIIYFPQSNVLHTGDTFFNGAFPYIDLKSGGSIEGDIKAGKMGLMLINDE
ncbi:MAG: MBL fold metallo-hydrolase, partial [Leeuwenhoekiella sp.]